jgi:hypothetical protein
LTSTSNKNRLDAEVYSSGKRGMNTVVSMKVGTEIFKTEFREHAKFEIGQKISILVDLAGACLFDADGRLIRVLGARNG